MLTQLSPLSGVADAYRGLRTSIGLMWLANESETGRTEPRTLIVASPGPNEGKSTTDANLAAAYAEMGKSVIVVDLDFRRQRLHKFLGADAEPHLANIGTLSEPRVDLDSITQSTSIPGVRFIGSATPDSTPAEATVAGRATILAAQASCDIVIIDTPPLLLTNDTFDLLDFADAVLLLVRDGRTKTTALARASPQLRRLDAPVLGIALIGAVSGPSRLRLWLRIRVPLRLLVRRLRLRLRHAHEPRQDRCERRRPPERPRRRSVRARGGDAHRHPGPVDTPLFGVSPSVANVRSRRRPHRAAGTAARPDDGRPHHRRRNHVVSVASKQRVMPLRAERSAAPGSTTTISLVAPRGVTTARRTGRTRRSKILTGRHRRYAAECTSPGPRAHTMPPPGGEAATCPTRAAVRRAAPG